jgi:hypothetical protein
MLVVIVNAHGSGSMFLGFAGDDGIEEVDDRLSVLLRLDG